MKTHKNRIWFALIGLSILLATGCKAPDYGRLEPLDNVPSSYGGSTDSITIADITWKEYFRDSCLISLIDTALKNNQELNMILLELHISQNEIMARKGEYLPSVGLNVGGGADKVGRYTTQGAFEATTELTPGEEIPEIVPDLTIGAIASWETDIWGELRNARKAAAKRYLASMEGKNFMVTNMVAEIATSYYELQSLDRSIAMIDQNIELQTNALRIVRMQKESAKATELAVKKFEAEVLHTKSLRYGIQQERVEVENRINFLLGRYPQKIERSATTFDDSIPTHINVGVPIQLLDRRTDVMGAQLNLEAAKLDVKSAKAAFYPSLGLNAGVGLNALNPTYLIRPQSLMFNIAGDLVAPLVNRNVIKARFYNANAQQVQTVYEYEQTLLNAYMEVANQLSNIENLQNSYDLKSKQVQTLTEGVNISNNLFLSARADYMEVLTTQRDALEAKFELIETKRDQLVARVNMYRALGGGWK